MPIQIRILFRVIEMLIIEGILTTFTTFPILELHLVDLFEEVDLNLGSIETTSL